MSYFFIEFYKYCNRLDSTTSTELCNVLSKDVSTIIKEYLSDKWLCKSIVSECECNPLIFLKQWMNDPCQQTNNPLYVCPKCPASINEDDNLINEKNAIYHMCSYKGNRAFATGAAGFIIEIYHGVTVNYRADCIIGFCVDEKHIDDFEIIIDKRKYTKKDCTDITVCFLEKKDRYGRIIQNHVLYGDAEAVITPTNILSIKDVFPFSNFSSDNHTIQINTPDSDCCSKIVALCINGDHRKRTAYISMSVDDPNSKYVESTTKKIIEDVNRLNGYLKIIHDIPFSDSERVPHSYYVDHSLNVPFPTHISKLDHCMTNMMKDHYNK